MGLSSVLKIERGVTAIIGGGGKTTLMYALAEELRKEGSVIVCTSTHIRVPDRYPLVTGDAEAVRKALEEYEVICAGTYAQEGKNPMDDRVPGSAGTFAEEGAQGSGNMAAAMRKLTSSAASFAEMAELADFVLVEADGSKGLPLKAHAAHEPVIPDVAGRVILVVGADGFGKPVREVCHRPEIWTRLAGVSLETNAGIDADELVVKKGTAVTGREKTCGMVSAERDAVPDMIATPEGEARVITAEGFGDIVFVNKVESDAEREAAEELAKRTGLPTVAGSLHQGVFECLY